MNSDNTIWQLISHSLSGEISQEELLILQEILKDEQLQQQYEILQQFWHSSDLRTRSEYNGEEQKIAGIFEKAKTIPADENFKHKTRRRLRRKIAIITSGSILALVFIIIGLYFFLNSNTKTFKPALKFSKVVVQKGSKNKTVLPDGSSVWLNAGSTLTYNTDFNGATREVYLKGEAFFDVIKKNKQPFIVHANSVDIKVLGTAFNIKSYIDDNKVEATLIRGIIQVTRPGKINQQPLFLHPNEKLVINLDESTGNNKTKAVNTMAEPAVFTLYHLDSTIKKENLVETSWMYNRLEFRGDDFTELGKKLERWYDIKIIFQDSAVQQLNFNGSFENETVEQAFADLKAAVSFNYIINNKEIFVRSNNTTLP